MANPIWNFPINHWTIQINRIMWHIISSLWRIIHLVKSHTSLFSPLWQRKQFTWLAIAYNLTRFIVQKNQTYFLKNSNIYDWYFSWAHNASNYSKTIKKSTIQMFFTWSSYGEGPCRSKQWMHSTPSPRSQIRFHVGHLRYRSRRKPIHLT